MLNRILIIIVLIYLNNISLTFAQYFNGGVLIGITGSQIDGDSYGGYNKPGLTAGVFVYRNINYLWSYQAELKYIMKGAANKLNPETNDFYRKTLHYIEIPILIKYKNSKKVVFETGISSAYLGYASVNVGNGIQDVTQTIKKYDFNAIFGIYYYLSDNTFINLKFAYSIIPISHIIVNRTIWNTYGQYNNLLTLAFYFQI